MKSMENKTIEEMNSAVIQEINRLCPNDFNLKENQEIELFIFSNYNPMGKKEMKQKNKKNKSTIKWDWLEQAKVLYKFVEIIPMCEQPQNNFNVLNLRTGKIFTKPNGLSNDCYFKEPYAIPIKSHTLHHKEK